MKKIFAIIAALTATVALTAQSKIGFEDNNCFKTIGIYDRWEESPFRTGKLDGNCAVIDNHLKDEANGSDKILAVQRSRFGSNTFGVRIDLKEPFELSTVNKNITFQLNRPYEGRVMVIGLGRRADRPWQAVQTEQFTRISEDDVPADSWQTVSIPVKGAPGVLIYSIVIVPDCESPHDYPEDKACYIDNISY